MPLASRPKTLRSLRPRSGTAAPRPRPARAGRATTADPITTEIILGAFETICYEMATPVSLTATTPILNQSNERNAPDIWAEGVRFPAVKIYEKGVKRRDVEYMMAVNNRTPTFLGDLRAQVGAAQLGVARLKEVLARFGPPTVEAAVRGIIAYAKRRFREEVAKWPDGVYESDVYVDHDPHGKKDIHVHCRVTVKGSDLTVDFTGSDDRPDIQAYSTFGNTRGYVVAQLASMMDPKIPKNEGFFDSIDLIVPKGCCLHPPEGKSVAAGTHHPGTEVGEAVAKALEPVVPERSCPQVYKMGMPTVIFGTNPRDGKMFIDHSVDTFAAYCGAVKGQDGWGGMNVSFGNL